MIVGRRIKDIALDWLIKLIPMWPAYTKINSHYMTKIGDNIYVMDENDF